MFQGFMFACWTQFLLVDNLEEGKKTGEWNNTIFYIYSGITGLGMVTLLFTKSEIIWNPENDYRI